MSAAGPFPSRRHFVALLAAAGSVVISGCAADASGATHGGALAGPRDVPVQVPAWLLARQALAQVAADPLVAAGLARTRVYELVQPGQQPLALAGALPAVIFASAAQLVQTVQNSGLPARTQAVVYDPEAWPFTPAGEQRDPVTAAAGAARAARARGLQFIVAPALNLTTVLAPGSRTPRAQLFLELDLPARLAEHADMIEFQAQSLERDAASYSGFVAQAAQQARLASPSVGLLAGVSTNPPGALVTAAQLVTAIRATQHLVDGFWLNVPSPGPQCPTCNPPRPEIAIATLLAFV
ncbi:MAG TPA: hypothetical protein VEL03_12305 [Streptosporangiaceae bacterium]|nr:hypothetical protein [Streptosporangiaceae bacterium]